MKAGGRSGRQRPKRRQWQVQLKKSFTALHGSGQKHASEYRSFNWIEEPELSFYCLQATHLHVRTEMMGRILPKH